jgi:hypothetical protein
VAPSLYLINPRCDAPAYFGAEIHVAHGFAPAVLIADGALPTVGGWRLEKTSRLVRPCLLW